MNKPSSTLFALVIFYFAAANALPAVEQSVRSLNESDFLEDGHLTPTQLIKKYGYHGETHQVMTEDGYFLTMHRITGPNSNPSAAGKQPILLLHPLLSCSADWIMTGPGKAFGYILADQGYDVWLGNVRGNKYSQKHNKWTTDDREYWQFSWHEIGTRDLPAMIDYILGQTNRQQLIYGGHSQGTTIFWAMATERPEYQKKVKAMFALAPVAYLSHTKNLFYKTLSKSANRIDKIADRLGCWSFSPLNDYVKELIADICKDGSVAQPACANIIFLIAGFGSDQFDQRLLPVILGHLPAGASFKQFVHYMQVVRDRKFQQFDYGLRGNLKKYRRIHPPVYDLSKIKIPVSLHYGQNDVLSVPRDVKRLYNELGNPIGYFRVPNDKFTHLDFMWATDGKQLVYDKVISLMHKYKD